MKQKIGDMIASMILSFIMVTSVVIIIINVYPPITTYSIVQQYSDWCILISILIVGIFQYRAIRKATEEARIFANS